MTLYCFPRCIVGHRVRIVLFEKGIAADIEYLDPDQMPADVLALSENPTGPIMVDRDLVLTEPRIIIEYLDERFPHPPLHPMDPVSRARARMLVHRIDQEWYPLVEEIERLGERKNTKARKQLRESLLSGTAAFGAKPYFLSEEFSIVDCALAPLLWRLPALGIDLPKQAGEPIRAYAVRLFQREAFRASLSEQEREYAPLAEAVYS